MSALFNIVGICFVFWLAIVSTIEATSCKNINFNTGNPDTTYVWKEAKGFGNGSFEYEWREGTFPLAIKPVLGPDNHLWMPGQKAIWESADGLNWRKHVKTDWGERISMCYVYFKDTLWMYGGMMYPSKKFMNDIWSTVNGKSWSQSPANGTWKPRKGQSIIAFKNKLWLFGGSNGVNPDFSPNSFLNDIWSSEDGKHWTLEKTVAEWAPREYPRIIVFKDMLFMVGGQGYGDVWKSSNGIDWTLIIKEAPWKKRYDYGTLVYDDKIWVFGGGEKIPSKAYNDVWSSQDGVIWKNQTLSAPWTKRSAVHSVVFDSKIWLFSGKHTGAKDNWGGDIWTMEKREDHFK